MHFFWIFKIQSDIIKEYFEKFFEDPHNDQLLHLSRDKSSNLHLKVLKTLADEEIEQLDEFITNHKPFPYTKLSLTVDLPSLTNPKWLKVLQKLNNTSIAGIELIFTAEEVKESASSIIDVLTASLAPIIAYPIHILESDAKKIVPTEMPLQAFEQSLIANIQQRHKKGIESRTLDDVTTYTPRSYHHDPMKKEIKLKKLVKNRSHESMSPYISLEVQHVETIEQEIVLEQEEVLEHQLQLEFHEIQEYNGELLGFEEFSSPRYKKNVLESTHDEGLTNSLYALLESELFANLPHAIKFISPDAAEQLSFNLPGLVTLNKDNLPSGFILKHTPSGELVLDFDPYLENEHTNPFTPALLDIDSQPIYHIELKEQDVRKWIRDDQIANILYPADSPYTTPQQLINLWIKYGDEGVTAFFKRITDAASSNPEFVSFLLRHYLMHLPQWDHLHNNEAFFASIERVSRYDEQKLLCFKRFLQETGTSRHDFIKTVGAFESFWNELMLLAAAQKVSVAGINKHPWFTPKHGNPVVLMERMLCILKNARTLDEQFELLNGITLANYDAYYASQFEGFTAVSIDMDLNYNRVQQNERAFSKHFHLYRVNLHDLYESYPKLRINGLMRGPMPKEIPASFRFIGMQKTGITVRSLRDQFATYAGAFQATLMPELMAILLFISHERYVENQPLDRLFKLIAYSRSYETEVLRDAMMLLKELYQRDIKLNQIEGRLLFTAIGGMNEHDFEDEGLSQKRFMMKLLKQLEQNKFAVINWLSIYMSDDITYGSKPKTFALDTAEFFAKQDRLIAATYGDNLLLFSGLINGYDKLTEKELNLIWHYLYQAARQEQPNNLQYAIQRLIGARHFLSQEDFISACSKIEQLTGFDSKKTDDILRDHKFNLDVKLGEFFTFPSTDDNDLNTVIIAFIIHLENMDATPKPQETEDVLLDDETLLRQRHHEDATPTPGDTEDGLLDDETLLSQRHHELSCLSSFQLQEKFDQLWTERGVLFSITFPILLRQILNNIKDISIRLAFGSLEAKGLLNTVGRKVGDLSDFEHDGDLDKVNQISQHAKKIAELFSELLKNSFVQEHEDAFIDLFESIDFSKFDYETLYGLLSLLTNMPQRNHLRLLKIIFSDERFIVKKEAVIKLIYLLEILNNACFPSDYLEAFSKFVITNPEQQGMDLIANQMSKIYKNNKKDPILELIMSHSELTYGQVLDVLNVSQSIENYRDKIGVFLIHLAQTKKLDSFLSQIADAGTEKQQQILEILSKGHALNRSSIEYQQITAFLVQLPKHQLELLAMFYQKTPVSGKALFDALIRLDFNKPDDFQEFLLAFEKAPFGTRDMTNQFSTTEVERVVNQSYDFVNKTPYTYQYRKQLMESFLFVNEIGQNLPVYYNKPAKDLTNAEIKSYFSDLKANKIANLTPFQRRLMALGLMREAMYRSTGEFPYSTQMIALIDGMMHSGDFISNIDTGQGKSMVDTMKATLLWLDSDRVDLTTSSMVDAKRDIAHYGPFLRSLGIPYSESPISSVSPLELFQQNGINFSTFSQLSLFFAKAKVTGVVLDNPDTIVSLVVNESDHTILDDRVIYRFAIADGSGISYGQEWIYYAINEFVSSQGFIENQRSTARDDIENLKAYLERKASDLKKSGKIVDKFDDEQYLSWLESAIIVNYFLKENDDYVIPDEFEKKIIGGRERQSKVVKVLMRDGKVSPDSTFGNGIQQLLYARLNADLGREDFIIEPPNKTIISSNNKGLIDYYIAKEGFIWGSSGTVGSEVEIQEQYVKYGFDFSKAEPHQKNRVIFNEPIIAADETAQFKQLISLLTAVGTDKDVSPSIVFCKDIDTATRLFKELEKHNPNNLPLQLYTGLGKEEDYIKNAGKPGMITITTSALGRNTDISYDRTQGLRVWHTFVDSIRGMGQKSGRTGRQGSAGEVNFVFNAQERGNRSIAELQDDIDQAVALERLANEELYNVLGFLLRQVDLLTEEQFTKGKPAFLRESWAQFSSDTETKFRASYQDPAYNKEAFIKKTLASFNVMLNMALTVPIEEVRFEDISQIIEKKHPEKIKYRPHQQRVTLQDCTPPVAIAYNLLQFSQEETQPEETKKIVKAKINLLFQHIQQDTFVAKNNDYLAYLVANPTTQEVIVEGHKEFLTEYLQTHSKKLNFVQRWLGYEGKLNKVASNENYLLMFHALASIPNSRVIELDVIKQSIHTLLDEYLETSWFISSERRAWAIQLQDTINQATTVDDVIDYLSQAQVGVARQDIETNKRRGLKSLHLFGHSRYQTTLGRALNLTASLSGKTDVEQVTEGLIPLINEISDQSMASDLTADELKHQAEAKKSDRSNASVMMKTLENALSIKDRKDLEGMTGRNRFFNPSDAINSDAIDRDDERPDPENKV